MPEQFCFTDIITDPNTESRLPLLSLNIYVPRDERFSHIKFSDFLAYALKSLGQIIVPEIKGLFDKTPNEFETFQDVLNLYEGGIKLPEGQKLTKIREYIPWEMLKELIRSDGEQILKFPMPDVIKGNTQLLHTLDYAFPFKLLSSCILFPAIAQCYILHNVGIFT